MSKIKNSISYKLLLKVIFIYFAVTLLVTAAQIYVDIQYQKKHIKEELQTIVNATSRSFANAFWDMNSKQIDIEAQGIIKLSIIKAIQIVDKNGKTLLERFDKDCSDCVNTEFFDTAKLYKKIFNKDIYLGNVTVYSDNDVILQRTKENFIFIFLSALFKSAILILLFIFAFKKYLQKPLSEIVSQINNINLEKGIYKPIKYDGDANNELILLKNSVNGMLLKIEEQVEKLNENKLYLEKEVKSRTQELRESNNQLESVIKGGNLGFWDWNLQNGYYEVNQRWREILGLEKNSIISEKDWQNRILKEDEETVLPIIMHALKYDKMYTIEYRLRHKEGHYVWIESSGSLIQKDKLGHPLRACGIHKDITKRKEAEFKVTKQKNFLNTLLQNAPIPIFYKDNKGIYLGVNNSWSEMIGFTKNEILNKSVYDVAQKEIADIYAKQDEKVFNLEENPQIYKSIVVNKDTKEKFDVMFYKSAFFDEDGKVAGLIGSILDLTEITKLEEEKHNQEQLIYEQSKLASMGEMIANIAHQWRQPLSIISTYATGIGMHKKMDILTDDMLYESCEKINENAQYLSQTIDDFKSFIKGNDKIITFELKNEMNRFTSLIDSIVKQHQIKLFVNISDDVIIHGYPTQLLQCFINIFNNSKDAYDKNQEKLFFIEQESIDDKNIVISFKDNAGGIQEDVINKIFEPYFTTKHQSQGTGLGLHMTHKLIQDSMDGTIKAENITYDYEDKIYTGAQFKITFPI
jgi:PAS domain S-box-containing protein